MLIEENRWRAKRYGIDEGLVDFGKGEVVPCAHLLDELIELTREDASSLDCEYNSCIAGRSFAEEQAPIGSLRLIEPGWRPDRPPMRPFAAWSTC